MKRKKYLSETVQSGNLPEMFVRRGLFSRYGRFGKGKREIPPLSKQDPPFDLIGYRYRYVDIF